MNILCTVRNYEGIVVKKIVVHSVPNFPSVFQGVVGLLIASYNCSEIDVKRPWLNYFFWPLWLSYWNHESWQMVNEEPIISTLPRCLTITEKVSFNIASEASYLYIFSAQKFIKNARQWSKLVTFGIWSLQSKIGGKYPKSKIQMRHFESFSDIVIAFYFVLKPEVSLWLPHLQLESWKSRCYLMVPP